MISPHVLRCVRVVGGNFLHWSCESCCENWSPHMPEVCQSCWSLEATSYSGAVKAAGRICGLNLTGGILYPSPGFGTGNVCTGRKEGCNLQGDDPSPIAVLRLVVYTLRALVWLHRGHSEKFRFCGRHCGRIFFELLSVTQSGLKFESFTALFRSSNVRSAARCHSI